eukprot:TRINITY_DN2648_c0_g2_i1.p2 TRINITY_DN2648_c0_g2~~TRINITY_DN2648_c0_g2_i1.p2  ORF type:complete len:307 (-),score=106.26 TRINITY_DN2648_c0_g2_i1:1204-2124(-)
MTCAILYEMCVDEPTAKVINIDSRPKKKFRPFPMTTVELQKQAARKLHLGSEQTMTIAEKLYQQGYLSYPRTETDSFPEGTDIISLIREQANNPDWGSYASDLTDQGKFKHPSKGRNNDNSHPPIHPTKAATNLTGNEKKLYDYITRHFLACCSEDALGQETTIVIEIAGEIFTAKGLIVEKLNWLEVFPYEKWTDKNLPKFQLEEEFGPTSLLMTESSTTAPHLITEPELISIMDKHGIGTDATIAQHIKTIQDRKYVEKKPGAQFVPTRLGEALVYGYNTMGFQLAKPQLRAETEAAVTQISRG